MRSESVHNRGSGLLRRSSKNNSSKRGGGSGSGVTPLRASRPNRNDILSALAVIPSDERETWLRVGAALKTELGDEGFDLWDTWSQTAASYRKSSMGGQWRSLRRGDIQINTLFYLAKKNGWAHGKKYATIVPATRDRASQVKNAELAATRKAARMLADATLETHPYLAAKGHPNVEGFVLGEHLLVPVRSADGKLASIQTITADGTKKFILHSRVGGGRYSMGRGRETWVCEGYATALSLRMALTRLYRDCRVVVAFSAGNIPKVARKGNLVVCDNDPSGTGRKYAEKTRCAWWMPPDQGDANDYSQRNGVDALARELRDFINNRRNAR